MVYHNPFYMPVLHHKVRHLGAKADPAAQLLNLFSHIFHYLAQHIRTDMGLLHIENLRVCAVFHKKFQNLLIPSPRILDHGI